jgi:hypothetical protein
MLYTKDISLSAVLTNIASSNASNKAHIIIYTSIIKFTKKMTLF